VQACEISTVETVPGSVSAAQPGHGWQAARRHGGSWYCGRPGTARQGRWPAWRRRCSPSQSAGSCPRRRPGGTGCAPHPARILNHAVGVHEGIPHQPLNRPVTDRRPHHVHKTSLRFLRLTRAQTLAALNHKLVGSRTRRLMYNDGDWFRACFLCGAP